MRIIQPKSSDRSGSGGGYSLVELIIVVVIIGVFSSLSISYVTEISRGQIVIQNLENMRSWLEATRRAALRGQACTVTITTANAKDNNVVLGSSLLAGSINLTSNPCGSPNTLELTSPYRDRRYSLSVRSDGTDVNTFVYTPRGTLFKDLTEPAFPDDLIYTLTMINSSGGAVSKPYCMRVSGFLGSVQSIGSQACSE
jgi:prepilin-type N-terminal cleavage/methylation domain-containing protein